MTEKLDHDFKALKHAVLALQGSTSRRTLRANLNFIIDYFWEHPSKQLPERLRSPVKCD